MSDSPPPIVVQKQFWNEWNAEYRAEKGPDLIHSRCGDQIVRFLTARGVAGAEIFEIGCGTGWLTERLIPFGNVTAIDLADDIVSRARARVGRATFIAGDVMTMALPKERFDVVASVATIAHVWDQQAFVDKAADALKPGGYFALVTTNRFVLRRLETVAPQAPGQIRKWLGFRDLWQLLHRQFKIEEMSTIGPVGHLGVLRVINSERLDNALSRPLGHWRVEMIKERLGLGMMIVTIARKRIGFKVA